MRSTRNGDVQRYLCRSCGYRFSETIKKIDVFRKPGVEKADSMNKLTQTRIHTRNLTSKEAFNKSSLTLSENVSSHSKSTNIPIVGKDLYALPSNSRNRQVCVSEREPKNLIQQRTRQKQAAGATLDTKGYIVTYEAKMILKGLKPLTILRRISVLRLLMKRGANLLDPKSTFKTINHAKRYDHATQQLVEKEWSEGSKSNAAQAYKGFCETVGIQIPRDINFNKWSRRHQKIPWIPLEIEIDSLIAGCSKKIAGFLQLIKETWCRAGEAWRLEWTDVDSERNIVTINEPEKDGLPHQFKVSAKLIAMLNALPRTNQRVFGNSVLKGIHTNFRKQRVRIAHKLKNPRMRRITFHTLRHCGATMEYHRTKDLLHVK